jgi:response regulator RpfG family c-di-GMP phosphodiesterase
VAEYAKLLATLYGLDEEQANLIQVASAVHDIGKVAIPDIILNKAARLDEAEFSAMKDHASMGAEMLRFSKRSLFTTATAIAAEHHERWDGTGYPSGKPGDEINLAARIVAIADVFDALTNNRVYRSAWTATEALKYIESSAGTQFDPALTKVFIENADKFLAIRASFP